MILLVDSEFMSLPVVATLKEEIHRVRGQRVMLDVDLAAIYGVSTKRLNEQLRRNAKRFPIDFAFQLTREEFTDLKSQFATSTLHGGKRKLPWVFTEHGAIMIAGILSSPVAIEASVRVVRAFVQLREMVSATAALAGKLRALEGRLDGHDAALAQLFEAIRQLLASPTKKKGEIGFHVRERSAVYRAKKMPRK